MGAALGVLLFVACYPGREPPSPTKLVTIPGGAFRLGLGDGSQLKCGSATSPSPIDRCDSGNGTDPLAWIDDLTFVPWANAKLERFEIDETEVTNAQYRYCVESGDCFPPLRDEIDGRPYYADRAYDQHPVVWVTRDQAARYCTFIGAKLPTEAQWEQAARLAGGEARRSYPWPEDEAGNCTPTSSRYVPSRDCPMPPTEPAPVGKTASDATYYRVRDMAGNVSELVADSWDRYAYCVDRKGYSCQAMGASCKECKADCALYCDPAKLAICQSGGTYLPADWSGAEWVVRGGSYRRSACFHRLFVRRKAQAVAADLGFRCAK